MDQSPITQSDARFMGTAAVVNLIIFYAVAFGIWGPALEVNFVWFAVAGIVAALLIIGFLSAPLFVMRRTLEHVKTVAFVVGIWIKIAILIGVLGLIVWGARAIFFH